MMFFIVFLLFFIPGPSLHSQFNIKIGYDVAYSDAPVFNETVSTYNQAYGNVLNQPLNDVHFLHGLNIGLRYKTRYTASEISWESLGNSVNPVEIYGDNAEEKTVYLQLNHLAYSQELVFGSFGLGISAAYGFYNLEADLQGTSKKRNLSQTHPFSTKFYLTFEIKASEILSFAIKPFYRYVWHDGMQLNGVQEYWEIDTSTNRELFHQLGIHLCFYNGPQ